MSARAATVGFDWTEKEGSRAKVAEELRELDEAALLGDAGAMEHELGDVFFALVNYARHLGVDPETALRKTNERFRRRFDHVERKVRQAREDWPRENGKATAGVPLQEMESAWQEAKELEKRDK